ncbi:MULTISPECIES: hypothetical protein [Lysinibacillus]|uniref:Uncharacterized protein n=1 Tax=Lysinibacillus xylanilyticus TaxID=582475 RepID=A0ABV3VQ69_9BACI
MIITALIIISFTVIAIAFIVAWVFVANKGTKIKELEKRIEELERSKSSY